MDKLVYYEIPREYTNYINIIKSNFNINQNDFHEIVLTDNMSTIDKKWNPKSFFVENIPFLCSLLMSLWVGGERVFFTDTGSKTKQVPIDNLNSLYYKLEVAYNSFRGYQILYRNNNEISKIIINDNQESLVIVARNSYLGDILHELKKIAREESFYKYELGEQ